MGGCGPKGLNASTASREGKASGGDTALGVGGSWLLKGRRTTHGRGLSTFDFDSGITKDAAEVYRWHLRNALTLVAVVALAGHGTVLGV